MASRRGQKALGFAQGREHSAGARAPAGQRQQGGCEAEMGLHGCWDSNRRLGLGVLKGKPNLSSGQLTESSGACHVDSGSRE